MCVGGATKTELIALVGGICRGWGPTDAWLVVVAVDLEFRTQVTSKCQSAVVDQLIVPLIWSLGRLLESPFGKSVENLTR